MFGTEATDSALGTIVHIIQVSLTPIFLLSGIATLLNVFATRYARVADQVDAAAADLVGADTGEAETLLVRLVRLHRRAVALDVAVLLAAVGGAATCGAVLTLFVGAMRDTGVAYVLFVLFGLAVVCALGAIVAYTTEMLMAGTAVRAKAARTRSRAQAEAGESEDTEPSDAQPSTPA
jgi:hypothetical protein